MVARVKATSTSSHTTMTSSPRVFTTRPPLAATKSNATDWNLDTRAGELVAFQLLAQRRKADEIGEDHRQWPRPRSVQTVGIGGDLTRKLGEELAPEEVVQQCRDLPDAQLHCVGRALVGDAGLAAALDVTSEALWR